MPITMTNHAPGMSADAYNEIMANVAVPLGQSAGFVSHSASVSPEGVTVTEVWESRDQWEGWFDAAVRPHLPAGAPEPTVVELHNALGR